MSLRSDLFDAGYATRLEGISSKHCKFTPGSEAWNEWMRGFEAAADDQRAAVLDAAGAAEAAARAA